MGIKNIFLFAHHDDEFAVYYLIEMAIKKGEMVYCLYLTDGNIKRQGESIKVLYRIGVNKNCIFFVGYEHKLSDGKLYLNTIKLYDILNNFFSRLDLKEINKIYIPAWEGGHQDHDVIHYVLVKISDKNKFLDKVYQYPLYHSKKLVYPLFKVLSPIKENGEVIKFKIPFINRIKYIMFCLMYTSQLKTWFFLFPFVFYKYLFVGYQIIQKVNVSRIREKPHTGKLLYEKRKIIDWEFLYHNLINLND